MTAFDHADHPNQQKEVLLAALDFHPPTDYLTFLLSNHIVYDEENYCYLSDNGDSLYGATKLIQANSAYNADEIYPGYFLIGSDGGGEAYAIEKASGHFVMTPFIGHDEDTPIIVGQTWVEFLEYLHNNAV